MSLKDLGAVDFEILKYIYPRLNCTASREQVEMTACSKSGPGMDDNYFRGDLEDRSSMIAVTASSQGT